MPMISLIKRFWDFKMDVVIKIDRHAAIIILWSYIWIISYIALRMWNQVSYDPRSYKHSCVHNCEDHSLLNHNFVCNLFVSLYFSLVWSHSCESKLHSGNNMILTSLIRNSDCCQCKYIEWRSCRRSAHDQTGCWPARSEATCIHSGYADCSLQSRQFLRVREGYILTILRWQLLLLLMFFLQVLPMPL